MYTETMLKKILLTSISLVVLVVGGAFLFKDQIIGLITDDIFIAADTDVFDPGLPVGDTFPSIRAVYEGNEISSIDSFVYDKGMIFIANRSADW
ncbi:MAG: hypothetical protein AB8B81_06670 [Halioglobus sp.]